LILEDRIKAGQRNSIKLAFSLFTISDASFSEALDIMLGKMIRKYPHLFLQELLIHRSFVTRLDALLGNLGEEFVDDEIGERNELKLRLEAIKSVNDRKLINIKLDCIRELEGLIK
jgi:hypothetical protein